MPESVYCIDETEEMARQILNTMKLYHRKKGNAMNTENFELRETVRIVAETDVLIVGGGPGGLGAAVTAARCGVKTILTEQYGMLGGMSSMGGVTPFMLNHFGEPGKPETWVPMDRPVYMEWRGAMEKYLTPDQRKTVQTGVEEWSNPRFRITPELSALAMEDLCLEAGVTILYHHTLTQVVMEDSSVGIAVFHTKGGFVGIRARAFVDATGDGDLAALAGAEFEFGGASGYCQPMTLCFKLAHIDKARIPENLSDLYREAVAAGTIHCPRENILKFDFWDDIVHFNTTRVIKKSAIDGKEFSEAESEGHAQFKELFHWLRTSVPGFENASIQYIAPQIGVRESRRILGLQYLTQDDFVKRSKFPDAIARCHYNIDIHNPLGQGTVLIGMPYNEYYEIPFGCLVPRGLKNVAVAGRPISVSHELHSSSRVMPPACSVGQGAGAGAALSVRKNIPVAELDGVDVRRELIRLGAWL